MGIELYPLPPTYIMHPSSAGPSYRGNPKSHVSCFSFGTIKTATALGGALFRVKDKQVLDKMRRLNASLVPRSSSFFAKRLTKYGLLHGISTPGAYGVAVKIADTFGIDMDELITSNVRGFPGELVSPAG